MHMYSIPFKPRHLTLAIATALLATQPAVRALAAPSSPTNSEWNCQPALGGKWSCAPAPANRVLAAAIPEKIVEQKELEKPTTSSNRQAPSVVATPSGATLTATLDWRPLAELTESQKAGEPFYSCGAYIEPARPGKNFKGDVNSAPIVAEANESTYDKESVATLKGNVKVRQGSRQLESDRASLDRNRNYGDFEGNVRFRDAGVLLVGDRGDLQLDSGRATLENTSYVMHEQKVRGEATQVARNEDSTLELSDATYTSCPPGQNSWELSGDNVTLDLDSGLGLAKDAVIRVKGLPVFYTPYLSFPIDDRRKSGFLYPTMGQNSDNGLDFSVPYYWNIAPNYDATITPRYMSKRGLLVENEFRYLLGNSHGEIGLAGLLNKDELHKDNPYFDENRWLINLRHQTLITSRWSAEVDYARASDKNYLEDFNSNLNLTNQSPLNQRIGTRYQGGDLDHSWQVRLDAHQYQNMSRTSDDPYNRLPQLALTGTWHATDSLDLSYLADYTKFSRDKNWDYINETLVDAPNNIYQSNYGEGYGIKRANGERMVLETGASYPMEWSYAFITPSVKIQHVQYQLSNLDQQNVIDDLTYSYNGSFSAGDYTETPKTTVPTVSIDSGLYFDRATQFGETSFTHTLEPRMKYLYSPYVEGQEMNPIFDTALLGFNYNSLWRDSRFSGYDRLGDANQLSIGVTSRLLEEDGFERARFGVGQILYFRDRQLWISPTTGYDPNDPNKDENWDENLEDEKDKLLSEMQNRVSPLASELVYNINRVMSIRQDLMWDTSENEIDDYGLYYTYKPDNRRVLNIGYRYRDQVDRYVKNEQNENIEIGTNPDNSKIYLTTENQLRQTDISFAWPVYNRWSAMGRWQYDITNKRNLEIMSGVEYNSCCYQVRLLWRNWIEDGSNIDHPDTKSGVFLQFVLRGLGNIATGSAKEYLEGIKGYTADEK